MMIIMPVIIIIIIIIITVLMMIIIISPIRADLRCRRCVDIIIMITAGDAEDAS